jgi:hypothetical protein
MNKNQFNLFAIDSKSGCAIAAQYPVDGALEISTPTGYEYWEVHSLEDAAIQMSLRYGIAILVFGIGIDRKNQPPILIASRGILFGPLQHPENTLDGK